jgi:plasmid stabilization system protein ParE
VVDVWFHPEARAEYLDALTWYQMRSPQTSAQFEVEVERALDLIKSNPTTFPKYDDEHRYVGLRRYPYSVIYRYQPDEIYVVAIAHSSRAAGYRQVRS